MRWLGFICIFVLAGCGLTSEGDAFRSTFREKSKAAAAASLENSEWYLCRAARIGSVKDRYGVSADKATAYNILCMTDPRFNPIIFVPKSVGNPL